MGGPKLKPTGRTARVQMGEWDGQSCEIDSDFPVAELSDGTYVVVLGSGELPDEPQDSPDRRAMVANRKNNY